MAPITLTEIMQATHGRLLFGKPNGVRGITIDSRRVNEGDVFVALKGERFDGHDFLSEALKKATGAVVSIPPASPPSDKCIIHVPNTLHALHDIARHLRRKYAPKVIGITGTNGKTTTKEMTSSILSTRETVLKNTGNLNNQVGLPLSLMALDEHHTVAVLEMGASAPGDIRELCGIAEPDFGVITNIGLAHIEGFKDIGAVRSAKMELFDAVPVAAVNADDAFLMEGISSYGGRLLKYGMGARGLDVWASDIKLGLGKTSFALHACGGSVQVEIKVSGIFNVYNALAASCAAMILGFGLSEMKQGLESFEGVPMRLELREFCGSTVISDVYNANPASMEEALKELIRLRDRRAVAVLGDMLELGAYAEAAHRRLGNWMSRFPVDVFIAVGPLMSLAAEEFERNGKQAIRAGNSTDARLRLLDICSAGDTVLIKGSRGMAMEKVINGQPDKQGEAH